MRHSTEKEYLSGGGLTHIHTHFSKDGRYTLHQIGSYVHRNLRSEYFAIADHLTSPYKEKPYSTEIAGARVINMLESTIRYNQERGQLPLCISGIEVNVMPGGLDVPDEVLGGIDFVVASRHFPWGIESTELFEENMLAAFSNTNVDVVGHIDRYTPERVDWRRLLTAAKNTNTVVEINVDSPPRRKVLEILAELGSPLTIGTDFHDFKGWIKERDVNTEEVDLFQPVGQRIMKPVLKLLKEIINVGIAAKQIVNLKDSSQFIDLLKIRKNERQF